MANTRQTLIESLVTGLNELSGVRKATNRLYVPSEARKAAPYIGVIIVSEEILVEDATAIRLGADIDLIMIAPDSKIDELVDKVKDYIYDVPSIGALQIKVIGHEEVGYYNEDQHSSVRITLHVTYVATKGAF